MESRLVPLLRVCGVRGVTPPPPLGGAQKLQKVTDTQNLFGYVLLSSEDWRLQCEVDARAAQMRPLVRRLFHRACCRWVAVMAAVCKSSSPANDARSESTLRAGAA